MSEPDDLDKLTEELNAAARSERPSDERKAAILEALIGKGGGGGGGGPKRGIAAIVALLAVLLGVLGVRSLLADEPTAPIVSTPPVTSGGAVVEPALEPPVAPVVEVKPPPPSPDPPPADPPPPEAAPTQEVKRPPAARPVDELDSLAKEVRLVDAARAALPAAPRQTLALLERHRREFPAGALKVEAELVRVEAHLRAGDRASAKAIVDRITRGAPDGPVAARARRLLEEIP